jgi:nicotinate-nucleotide adenylyltransferase
MYTADELKNILEKRLSKKRFKHSLNVADEAVKLAVKYGYADVGKAYVTGLLHDICKEDPERELLEMIKNSRLDITEAELATPQLYHAPAGAWRCKKNLGMSDCETLDAIRYHTVGRGNMGLLEKIIYLADLTSADRKYKDVNRIRKLSYNNMDKAMLEAIRFTISDVLRKGGYIPVHTVNAYNQYLKIKNLRMKSEK